MIAANVEAAKYIRKAKIPGLYRVHDAPEAERLEELTLFLETFGFKLPPAGKLSPKDVARVIDAVSGKPEAELVETVVLRSMKRACYQPRNTGHFGLGLGAYAHFTSPIRRYPDLLIHRAIGWVLENGSAKGFRYPMAEMEHLGNHCSQAERRADEAVWDVEEQLKCLYMRERVGEEFRVIVSSVMPFGLFVRVPELKVDGLVHVTSLPRDYYHRDQTGTKLAGERTGVTYGLTDAMQVRLVGANVEERKIDFVPVEEDSQAGKPGGTARGRGRKRGRRGRSG